MKIQAVTISVSDFERSRQFYEEVLDFEPDMQYEKWQSYKCEETAFFGITEVEHFDRLPSMDIINFKISDVDQLWERIKDKVRAETGPTRTSWGTYKIVIFDPDGYRLGFVEEE